ncbi:MAG: indolepyruvate ferredoxin oxidoreductase subunit alpha [Candidatus Aenigmatarchaeota archaeon]
MANPDLMEKEGKKVVLLGNEAIARGAIEAGMGLSACYPGTPSSEVGITLSSVAKQAGFYFEWSTNEKVAYEVAAGAAFSGVRALTAMKHFGLNVAIDSVMPTIYTGVKGGLVIMVSDDPLGHSSAQSEQDTRFYARMGFIPTLEPTNAQECKDFTKLAFEISEKHRIPVMLRTTTMVSHSIGTVKLGKIPQPKTRGNFVKDPESFYCLPPALQKLHERLNKKIDTIELAYDYLNRIEGEGKTGIIATGVSYQYLKEVKKDLNGLKGVKIAKLVMTYPVSKGFVTKFLKGLDRVFVLEELEPVVEQFVCALAKDVNPRAEIHGKDILSRVGEYNPETIQAALAPFLKAKKPDFSMHEAYLKKIDLPVRKAVLCPGCPHRSTFYAVKKVMGDQTVWSGDIGCYVLGIQEPYKMEDYIISMGSSIGLAHGIQKVSDQKVVVFMGDSTFFHAGMPPLVNSVSHGTKPIIVILDNGVTAMTGHQPHPGSDFTGMGDKKEPIKIEDVVKAFGITNVKIVNAFSQKELQAAIKEMAASNELGVIISRGLCRLYMHRLIRKQGGEFAKFQVVPGKCKKCLTCVKQFACPAIMHEGDKVYIREDLCWGCGVCAQVCPVGAIIPAARRKKNDV